MLTDDEARIVSVRECEECRRIRRVTLWEERHGLRLRATRWLCDRCRDRLVGLWADMPCAPAVPSIDYFGD